MWPFTVIASVNTKMCFPWQMYLNSDNGNLPYFYEIKFFSQKQNYFLVEDKLLLVLKHGFLRSEENVNLDKFQHFMVYEWWCVL